MCISWCSNPSGTTGQRGGGNAWRSIPTIRDTRDVLNIVHEFDAKGAKLRILEPAISTDGPMGKVVLTVLGMVAEMELGFIRDRQRAGIEAAKSRGIYKGRPAKLDWGRIKALHAEGKGPTEISKTIGCSRGMVYKVLWGKAQM